MNPRIPTSLNPFQAKMYNHLIDRKRIDQNLTKPGNFKGKEYDALIHPDDQSKLPVIYPEIRSEFRDYMAKTYLKLHKYFHHMVSSQAACINLFMPILGSEGADEVLKQIIPGFQALDRTKLYKGYYFEYDGGKNYLKDKTKAAGTDCDIAIAYINSDGKPCLWLAEHKLTEAGFTQCGGARSKGRVEGKHKCDLSADAIIRDPENCYYHSDRKNSGHKPRYAYWPITRKHQAFWRFDPGEAICPFKDGRNQLWRNHLLALAIQDNPHSSFEKVTFSLVKHPENHHLDKTIHSYQKMLSDPSDFQVFNSEAFVEATEKTNFQDLKDWAKWYRHFYFPDSVQI